MTIFIQHALSGVAPLASVIGGRGSGYLALATKFHG